MKEFEQTQFLYKLLRIGYSYNLKPSKLNVYIELRDNKLGKIPLTRHARIIVLLFLFLTLTFIETQITSKIKVSAETYEIGVEAGHWAKYKFSLNWSSDPPQPEPIEIQQAKQLNYTIVEVTNITGLNIEIKETLFYENKTQKTQIYTGNIKTGEPTLGYQIIAKNLTQGDKIWDVQESPSINITRPERYAGSTRMVNVLYVEVGAFGLGNWSRSEFQWDQKTGFLCKMGIVSNMFLENYTISVYSLMKWEMVETNLWEPEISSGFPGWVTPVIFVCIVGIVYLIIKKPFKKRLRKKLQKQQKMRIRQKENYSEK